MSVETLGIVLNGASGGIANRQHLERALIPMIREGGLPVGGRRIVPKLLLVGRDEGRLKAVADRFGLDAWTTDLAAAIADPAYPVVFDAGVTGARAGLLRSAIEAGKHVYAEKPVVTDVAVGKELLALAQAKGVKHGVVEDKLFLPGLAKLKLARAQGLIGRVVQFRLDFGYWIFTGHDVPTQRPSWNYRRRASGGLACCSTCTRTGATSSKACSGRSTASSAPPGRRSPSASTRPASPTPSTPTIPTPR